MKKNQYKIRKAKLSDVSQIHKLVNHYASKKLMLARSLNELYENIQGFFVAECKNKVIGCCALHITWEDLAEIKSLAVDLKHIHHGLGSKLLQKCQQEAKKLDVKRLFALTFMPDFFLKHGYTLTTKDKLPHKIWSECIRCPYFPDCKEVPLILDLK